MDWSFGLDAARALYYGVRIIFKGLFSHLLIVINIIEVTTTALNTDPFIYSVNICTRGALAAPSPKDQSIQKNPENHLEDPPEMQASQGSHTLNDGSTQSRATARTTPNNGHLQQERRANTTLYSGKTFIKKASDKIQSLLDASSI